MALFTDNPAFGLEDLAAHESGILETAAAEGIDLEKKISLAVEEIGIELLATLRRVAGPGAAEVTPGSIVVTSPLRLWEIYHTLETAYRDAYHNQLNDRYKGKWQEYRELSRWAAGMLAQTGVGVASDPVPEAGAPVLTSQFGGLAAGRYFARMAWVNSSGEEGAAGALASIDLNAGRTFLAAPAPPPPNAAGWNLYAGLSPLDLFRQTDAPLAAGTAWLAPDQLRLTGARPGTGQPPSYLKPLARVSPRG
jgi:hypothetical protein